MFQGVPGLCHPSPLPKQHCHVAREYGISVWVALRPAATHTLPTTALQASLIPTPRLSDLLKEQVTKGLRELSIFHQQEMAQCFKMCLQVQLHKEIVDRSFVHQADTGGKLEVRVAGKDRWQAGKGGWQHSLGSQRCRERALHQHRQRQQLT